MDSAQALIIIALRAKAVENAVDHLQPKAVTVVTSQESLEEIIVGCSGLRQRGVDFKYQPLDEAMEIAESFKRFDRVLAQFQRAGYSNREIFLDATGGTTPLRVGAALAAMMRNVKIVHQRVRQDRYAGGGWQEYTSEDIELLPMGNPLEKGGAPITYPGSPLIAMTLLGSDDGYVRGERFVFCDLDAESLSTISQDARRLSLPEDRLRLVEGDGITAVNRPRPKTRGSSFASICR